MNCYSCQKEIDGADAVEILQLFFCSSCLVNVNQFRNRVQTELRRLIETVDLLIYTSAKDGFASNYTSPFISLTGEELLAHIISLDKHYHGKYTTR